MSYTALPFVCSVSTFVGAAGRIQYERNESRGQTLSTCSLDSVFHLQCCIKSGLAVGDVAQTRPFGAWRRASGAVGGRSGPPGWIQRLCGSPAGIGAGMDPFGQGACKIGVKTHAAALRNGAGPCPILFLDPRFCFTKP